jgi:hypothetical protein
MSALPVSCPWTFPGLVADGTSESFGGPQMLRRSEIDEDEIYKDILRCTKGLIFFGTPHHGASVADLGNKIISLAKVAFAVRGVDLNLKNLKLLTTSPDRDNPLQDLIGVLPRLQRLVGFRWKTCQESHVFSAKGLYRDKVCEESIHWQCQS